MLYTGLDLHKSFSYITTVNVDAKNIEASYEDGILEVSLPKTAEVKPKKILVSAKKKGKANK